MDLSEFNSYAQGAIAQYDMPQNYELVRQKFELAMDDGFDITLSFIDRKTIEWTVEGDSPQLSHDYLCSKGDDTTYLVSYELESVEKRTNHTWVIDLENQLVTRVLCVIGDHPKYEYLIKPKYEFGAIKCDGKTPPVYPRHGFTNDMMGNIVQWFYGSDMTTVHVYYASDFYRITYPPEKASSRVFNEALAKLPSSDEPAAYIKIKEGMYLLTITEYNMEKIVGAAMPFRSNSMTFLQNYNRVYLVGRTFGTRIDNGTVQPLHLTYSAFGKILHPEEEYITKMLTDPNPFVV